LRLDPEGNLQVNPMGTTEHDTLAIIKKYQQLQGDEPLKAYIEKVHSMPQQGVASTFTFGTHYGFIRGILVALSIPFEEVTPQTWQGGLEIPKKTKEEAKPAFKARLLAHAQRLFPKSNFSLKTADAALIAEYGRRNENIINSKKKG